jgi:DNA-binding IclR family transcriptional regulator
MSGVMSGVPTTRQPSDVAKTLDRGLQILNILADNHRGGTLAEVADALGVHRTIAYRLLNTLERHRLVQRDDNKVFHLGHGLVRLAEFVNQDLRSIAAPVLHDLAETAGATANIGVPEGGSVVVLMTVEPRGTDVHVAYRAGQTHPLDRGSAGMSILANRPPQPYERDEVGQARERGYAVSNSELSPHTIGVSVGIVVRRIEASIGVSIFREEDIPTAAMHVRRAADQLASLLR